MKKSIRFRLAAMLAYFSATAMLLAQEAAKSEGEGGAGNPITGDTWLISAWETICKLAKGFWEWVTSNVHTMLIEELGLTTTDPKILVTLIAILTIMLASGAWAASIAQMRRHRAPAFFILGFFTFFVGPAYLLYHLEIKGEKEQKEEFARIAAEKRAEAAERKRLEEEQAKERGEEEPPAVSATGIVWDKDYFTSIQRKDDGTPAGPWDVTYNGVDVVVTEIKEVLPECIQVSFINQEGTALVGRIPYSKIEKWEDKA